MTEVKYISAEELKAIYKKPDVIIFDIKNAR